MKADIIIIGGGVVGSCISRELSQYDVDIVLLEKSADVPSGASKANTAILHAGFDPKPGTLKALLNVQGNALYDELAKDLDVPVKRIGSLVVAFDDAEVEALEELANRGKANGVKGLRILDGNILAVLEPNLNQHAVAALYAPLAGIVNPFEMVLACTENAIANGVRFQFGTEATGFEVHTNRVEGVVTNHGRISAKMVVNAAGVWADLVASMVGADNFTITPRKGEYIVLDRDVAELVHMVLFPLPTAVSKGIAVTPTTDGNILIGPTSEDIQDKGDVATSHQGISKVLEGAQRLVPRVSAHEAINLFAGIRAVSNADDFVIEPAKHLQGFINVAGIQSPGVTAAPAIAKYVVDLLRQEGITLIPKEHDSRRRRIPSFREASEPERIQFLRLNPRCGRIVCRCETVTEGEVLDAIHRVPGAWTLEGIKLRTRAGMGRCQGSFCGPRVVELLSRELGLSPSEVTLRGAGTNILIGRDKSRTEGT